MRAWPLFVPFGLLLPALFAPACADQRVDTPESPDGGGSVVDAGGDAGAVTAGAHDRLLLLGTVIGPDGPFDGAVLVEQETITCAAPGDACTKEPGASGATIVDTGGIIAPGMIDTHNHILFDIFDGDDWLPAHLYQNHDEWPNEPRYAAMLDVKQCLADASQGKPTWCPATYDGDGALDCEMDKWGELKALVAGTTSVVGLAGTTSYCYSSLARTIDAPQNDLDVDLVRTSSLFPPSTSTADSVCAATAKMTAKSFLIHCGEGIDDKSRQEFAKLGTVSTTDGCLYAPSTAITHGTAFTKAEFDVMKQHDMKLVWSPASNVALYGQTTNIPLALDDGITIALAPDWSMGGSQNLLDELRFANDWDDKHFSNRLKAEDLVRMVTINAAKVLGLDDRLGVITKGHLADLFVVDGDPKNPYDAIVAATPREVKLTMVGGHVLYGDEALHGSALWGKAPCDAFDACGRAKFLCVAEDSTAGKLSQQLGEIRGALEAALEDVDTLTSADGWNFAPLTPLVKCK